MIRVADPDLDLVGSGSGIIIPDPDPTNIIEEGRKFNIITLKEGGGTYQ